MATPLQVVYLFWACVTAVAAAHPLVPWLRDGSRYGKLHRPGVAWGPLRWTLPNGACFRLMYALGTAWAAWLLAETVLFQAGGARGPALAALHAWQPRPAARNDAAALVLALMLAQVMRRLLEAVAVARFSDARQPAAVAAVSALYYVFAVATPVVDSDLFASRRPGGLPALLPPLTAARAAGLALYAAGWAAQASAHRTLARLRAGRGRRKTYAVPRGALFRRVSSPHYACEIAIYTGLALVAGGRLSQLMVLAWVCANLSVTAARTHQWYLDTFPAYARLGRARLVPWVW